MKRPRKLKNTPLVESICEIRFESSLPSDIVPGMIASSLKNLDISSMEKLPILELPQSARNIDPNLMYAPYYRAKLGEITIQLGARMIALSSPIPYIGWKKFKPQIKNVVETILDDNIRISNIKRVAIRSVNFFDIDILGNSKFNINTPIRFNKKQYNYTEHYEDGNLLIRTTIANQAIKRTSETEAVVGSVIDIDAYIEGDIKANIGAILSDIDKTHLEGKNIFFDLLNDDFMESLGPEYD